MSQRIKCEICGAEVHSIQVHLKNDHPTVTLAEYQQKYPKAEILSELAKIKLAEAEALKKKSAGEGTGESAVGVEMAGSAASASVIPISAATTTKKAMHEVFGLGKVAGVMNARGEPIPVSVLTLVNSPELVPDIDPNYVFELESLKNVLMAIELDIPMYLWGHAGTGKTTLIEQVCARTNRPALRIQHTVNTEESHIVGQWTAKGGETHFELGPLAVAMKNGWVYLADEYDFALPSVLSVYQPVLEGKSLVIKEADAANRIIRPHPNFRFVSTGNTNGSGDETGLYQGTNIQNAANYDRFHMVLEIKYMKAALETQILINQASIAKEDAAKLVDFANRVRESYDGSKISAPISPRTLIAAAQIGLRKGSYRAGIGLSFANKLSKVDKEVVDGLAQRIFG